MDTRCNSIEFYKVARYSSHHSVPPPSYIFYYFFTMKHTVSNYTIGGGWELSAQRLGDGKVALELYFLKDDSAYDIEIEMDDLMDLLFHLHQDNPWNKITG